jgi:hypothetical protein
MVVSFPPAISIGVVIFALSRIIIPASAEVMPDPLEKLYSNARVVKSVMRK